MRVRSVSERRVLLQLAGQRVLVRVRAWFLRPDMCDDIRFMLFFTLQQRRFLHQLACQRVHVCVQRRLQRYTMRDAV